MSRSMYPGYQRVWCDIILEKFGNLPLQNYELIWKVIRFVVESLEDGSSGLKLRVETRTKMLLTSFFSS
jgi:hypothetical protein